MYGNVWRWAGSYRMTNKNIGIDKWQIPVSVKYLCDDTLFWIENDVYKPDEIAIRFKHRIVSIHCFPNGNGRHSRLMADIIIDNIYKKPVFTWGAKRLFKKDNVRDIYIESIRMADQGNYAPLLDFARS